MTASPGEMMLNAHGFFVDVAGAGKAVDIMSPPMSLTIRRGVADGESILALVAAF